MKKYVFRKYDPVFPVLFEKEKKRILKVLGEKDLIEHVGSTAVAGLGGKGIIDIFIATDKKILKDLSEKLESIGYKFGPKGGSEERLFHSRSVKQSGRIITYHVHVTFAESHEWKDAIGFRDYLKSNPKEAAKYAEIKKLAARKSKGENGDIYKATKKPFIDMLVKSLI